MSATTTINTKWATSPPHTTSQVYDKKMGDDDVVAETNGLDWCGRGDLHVDSHVDFERNEPLPLHEDRFLVHGAKGAVYSARCQNGRVVAWKKIYCPRGITQAERRELVVLKGLSHKRVIQLVGSPTQRLYLELLLWPVASTDLAAFLDGVDGFTTHQAMSTLSPDAKDDANVFIKELVGAGSPLDLLRQSIGCLISAVAYLHNNSVRHKDLKPANILLYPNGLRVTDFSTATDFSGFSQIASEGGDRGTPKYFSPEASALEPCGRASDIFSLGCIFVEMLAVANGHSLQSLKENRSDKDHSFQANVAHVRSWVSSQEFTQADIFVMTKITEALMTDASLRPTIKDIQEHLASTQLVQSIFHGKCCNPVSQKSAVHNSSSSECC